jgi:tetratricopeptide (TPR) repeat protein
MKRASLAALCSMLIASTLLGTQLGVNQNRGAAGNIFSISGKIIVPDSHFSDIFEVLLTQNLEQVVQATVADSQGRYRFTNLPRGTYFVNVKLEGYEEVRQRIDVGTLAENILNIIMDFKEERVVKPPMDYSGEDVEVVDLSELEKTYPAKVMDELKWVNKEVREANFQKVLPRLEALVGDTPDLYLGHRLLGIVYQKLNRIRDAESEFKTAAELKPTSAAPLVNLGSLYLQEAESSAKQGSGVVRTILNEALRSLNAAVKLKPDAAFAYYLLGVTYYRSAFYEDAEDNLKRAIELAPGLSYGHLALANVYIKIQEWSNAIVHLDKFLAMNPQPESRTEVEAVRLKVAQRSQAGAR